MRVSSFLEKAQGVAVWAEMHEGVDHFSTAKGELVACILETLVPLGRRTPETCVWFSCNREYETPLLVCSSLRGLVVRWQSLLNTGTAC